MQWRKAAWLLALPGLAGCASPPTSTRQIALVPGVPVPREALREGPLPSAVTPALAPQPSSEAPLAVQPDAWINFVTWCQQAGWSPPVADGTATSALAFTTQTPAGSWRIEIGSPVAEWNGAKCWLGVPPRLIGCAPHVFGLDLQKTILPLAQRQPQMSVKRVVVIDPGHGGANQGATSASGRGLEKDFTLDWALRVRGILAANGWTVHLTRTNDVEISLADRVAIAEQVRADFFISLHFNSSAPRTDQAGLESYCLTPTGQPSHLVRGFADDPQETLQNNAFDAGNVQLAMRLQEALVRGISAVDRGVRRARFMGVLRGQNRPAVLIEGGYLSNPQEANLIADARYRQKLAEALAAGIGSLSDSNAGPAFSVSSPSVTPAAAPSALAEQSLSGGGLSRNARE